MTADPYGNQPAPPPERVLREGRANHQRGRETVGGRLQLTDRVLRFVPHAMNLQTGVREFPLADLTGMRPAWTKLLGAVPIAPNSLVVSFRSGAEESFVLPGRESWMADIERAARAAGAPTP